MYFFKKTKIIVPMSWEIRTFVELLILNLFQHEETIKIHLS